MQVVTEATPPYRVLAVSPAWQRLSGFESHEVVGRPLKVVQGVHTEAEAVATLMHGVRLHEPVSVRLTNYTKSGETYVHQLSCEPLHDQTGRPQAFQATSVVLRKPGQPAETEKALNAVNAARIAGMLSLSSGVKRCPMLSPLVGAQGARGTTTTTASSATSSTTSSTTTLGGAPSLGSAPISHAISHAISVPGDTISHAISHGDAISHAGLHLPPISAISADAISADAISAETFFAEELSTLGLQAASATPPYTAVLRPPAPARLRDSLDSDSYHSDSLMSLDTVAAAPLEDFELLDYSLGDGVLAVD